MRTDTPRYRDALPQLGQKLFLADGGLETTLIFHEDWELPAFAAFVLLDSASGSASLQRYYERYIALALRHGTGLVLESPTWRASANWAEETGYTQDELRDINRRAIAQLSALRHVSATPDSPMVISGCIGPADDGYQPGTLLDVEAARAYHRAQAAALAATQADMLCAVTMTYVEEAIGVTLAAGDVDMPIAISFTVETDGKLPSGQSLADAIGEVDAATQGRPAYYMVNCAHPTHFAHTLTPGANWTQRIMGIRANASTCSHAELDAATELDRGDPLALAQHYRSLQAQLPNLRVLGGCCGTDHHHLAAIAQHCLNENRAA